MAFSVVKYGLAAAAAGVVFGPYVKDYLTLGFETQSDRKIRQLMQDKKLYFGYPHFPTKDDNNVGIASYGLDLPIKSRIASAEITVKWKDGVEDSIDFRCNDFTINWMLTAEERKFVNEYCVKTLEGIRSVSSASIVFFGFRTASQKLMVASALAPAINYSRIEEKIMGEKADRYLQQNKYSK